MKVFFITRSYWTGVVNDLKNIESTIKKIYPSVSTEFHEVDEKKAMSLHHLKLLRFDPPDFLFVGGWDKVIENIIVNVVRVKTKIILRWCSPLTQIDLGGEIPQFMAAINFLNSKKIDYIGIPLENEAEYLSRIFPGITHIPIYLNPINIKKVIPDKQIQELSPSCDLFCLPNPRKNLVTQFFALSKFPKLSIHTNYESQQYAVLAKGLFRERYYNYGHMGRDEYLSKLVSMDFGMQVTLSEGMNYTALEHMYHGIPVISSSCTPYAEFAGDMKPLFIDRPENVSKISNVIDLLLNDYEFKEEMSIASKKCFEKISKVSEEKLISVIKEILSK